MKKGFTLIELLAVIVILAVIALISIPLILGIIEDSKKGAFKNSVSLTFSAAELYESKNTIPTNGIELKDLSLKNNNFISGKIIKNSNNELEVSDASDGNYCAYGILTNLTVYKGSCDKTIPLANIVANVITSNSITLSATCSDSETEIIEYEFSKDGTNYISNGTSNTYKFENLSSGTNTYCVRCTNKALLKTVAQIDVSTSTIDTPTYNISPSGYSTSKIVSIDYPSGYTNEYSLDGGNTWLSYSTPLTITENKNVIARVNDGTNYVTGANFAISTIDNNLPTVNVSVSGKVGTITLSDNAGLTGYAVTTSTSSPTTWTSISGLNNTQTYTASTPGTYYAWVKDVAGNIKNSSFTVSIDTFKIPFNYYAEDHEYNRTTFSYTINVSNYTTLFLSQLQIGTYVAPDGVAYVYGYTDAGAQVYLYYRDKIDNGQATAINTSYDISNMKTITIYGTISCEYYWGGIGISGYYY